MQIELSGSKTDFVSVKVSSWELGDKIYKTLMETIRPVEAKGYDDWYINSDGNFVGVTIYHHGSDSETILRPALQGEANDFEAVKRVRKMLRNLP